MRFWDSSAVLPVIVNEATSRHMIETLAAAPSMAIWWGTATECVSAIARLEREQHLTAPEREQAERQLGRLLAGASEIQPSAEIRRIARRLLIAHPLRAADALQLAAASLLAGNNPGTLPFVTLDHRLAEAARREGFSVLPESS